MKLTIFYSKEGVGGIMTYGNMPVIIPILAAGYLLTIYLLLALARRTANRTSTQSVVLNTNQLRAPEIPTSTQVPEPTTVR